MAWQCLPRTPPVKSYSARMPFPAWPALLNAFFMASPLSGCCLAATDDTNRCPTFSVHHYQYPPFIRSADVNIPLLLGRMVRVRNRHRERAAENGGGFLKADSVLLEIRFGFLPIPLEVQRHGGS